MGLKTVTKAVETCDRCGRVIREIEIADDKSGVQNGTSTSFSMSVIKVGEDGEPDERSISYDALCDGCAGVVSNLLDKVLPIKRTRRRKKDAKEEVVEKPVVTAPPPVPSKITTGSEKATKGSK